MPKISRKLARKAPPELLRAAVYGANDGIVTTFAIVAGAAGASLEANVIVILGLANMMADGFSMAMGDFLAERSEQRLRKVQKKKYKSAQLWHSGLVTFIAFVIAGSFPLLPFFIDFFVETITLDNRFFWSIISTAIILFTVGSFRTVLTKGNWIKNGFEMLFIGAVAASAAYFLGDLVEHFVS